ncbi:phosphate-starvation-inducible PsiE family protein [Sulfuriferula sp. GW1]|uniref:phosphate-starvation-inducible PsiE family protein n=1 Tax=Sulfuriferula sp. GW1 TaxID=3345111 RepID=UPI0039AEE29B
MRLESGVSTGSKSRFTRVMAQWNVMTLYEKFEQSVALALTGLIAVIIVVALVALSKEVFRLVFIDAANPLDHTIFQTLFGQILTVLIALEFKHSILKVVARRENIIQVKTVLLIGLLAISRKFIILDIGAIQADLIFSLAAAVLALAIAYWLIRRQETPVGE